eukprot:TRINITY_DN15864_c0_g2_i1.p1 TRINITY_DN15864_c0_g2~~TRINITY_DN15864_c0_g2_i1.p1  ORF type:complete len:111 (+),score=6.46 TRINITY_DN15864_c0_g2_i1:755-1087(+)
MLSTMKSHFLFADGICWGQVNFQLTNKWSNVLRQNSGVSIKAITKDEASARDRNYQEDKATYYGVVKQIIDLVYTDFRQTVFYYEWVRVEDRTNGCIVDPETILTDKYGE